MGGILELIWGWREAEYFRGMLFNDLRRRANQCCGTRAIAAQATALSLMARIFVNNRVTFSSVKSFSGPVGAMSVKGAS